MGATPGSRCAVHGLAARADGRCVRCDPPRAPRDLGGPVRLILIASLLGAGAFVAFGAMRHIEPPSPPVTAAAPVVPVVAAAPAAPAPPPMPTAPPTPTVTPSPPPPAALPAQAAAVAPAVDEAEEHRRADEAYVAAARARRAAEIAASARSSVEIVMYSTSWCGYCRAARAWLASRGLGYVDHDIEREPAARDRMHAINPAGGVPTFEIDGLVAHGFSADYLEQIIAQAAARRAAR